MSFDDAMYRLHQLRNRSADYRSVVLGIVADHRIAYPLLLDALQHNDDWSDDFTWIVRAIIDDAITMHQRDDDGGHKIHRFNQMAEVLTERFTRIAQQAIGEWIIESERLPMQTRSGHSINPWIDEVA